MKRPHVICDTEAMRVRMPSVVALHAKVRAFLERATDCEGAHRMTIREPAVLTEAAKARFPDGAIASGSELSWVGEVRRAKDHRGTALPHAHLAARFAELAPTTRVAASVEYLLLLRDPQDGALLPYDEADFEDDPAPFSKVAIYFDETGKHRVACHLVFPFAEMTDAIVRITDVAESLTGVALPATDWTLVTPGKPGKRPFRKKLAFFRGAWVAKTVDDDAAMMEQILGVPDDDAPRQIYADLLLSRDDPRGTFINVQCELAHLAADHPRRAKLERLERQLESAHGKQWGRLPHHVHARFKRGFIDEVRVRELSTLTKSAIKVGIAAPLARRAVIELPIVESQVRELAGTGVTLALTSLALAPEHDVIARLADSALAPALQHLRFDLRVIEVSDELLRIANRPGVFPALTSLEVHGPAATPAVVAALALTRLGTRLHRAGVS